jgi:hypothetical protein
MTAIANLVIKKFDNTTSITWTALKGAGGDADPAVWRSDTATGYVGQKPTFSMSTKSNADGSVRRSDFRGVFPSTYTDTTTSVTAKLANVIFSATISVPQGMPLVDQQEAVAQIFHAIADPATILSAVAGYAPT